MHSFAYLLSIALCYAVSTRHYHYYSAPLIITIFYNFHHLMVSQHIIISCSSKHRSTSFDIGCWNTIRTQM